jgi:uncharacterized membrane protein
MKSEFIPDMMSKDDLRWVPPLLISLLAAGLRFFRLGNKSLWIDELLQVVVSERSLPEMIEGISYHLSPPLDYFLLHLIGLLGNGDYLVRVNAAVFGVLAVAVFYYLLRELFTEQHAVVGGILLALSRFHIHYSQEVRMYSLFCFLTLVSVYLYFRAVKTTNGSYLVPLTIVNSLLLYTHYYGSFVLLTEAVFTFFFVFWKDRPSEITSRRRFLGGMLGSFLLPVLFFLPWVRFFLIQVSHDYYQNTILLSSGQNIFFSIIQVFSEFSWPSVFHQIVTIRLSRFLGVIWPKKLFSPFEMVFVLLFLFGFYHSIKSKPGLKGLNFFLILWILIPLTIVGVLSGRILDRYFIFILPAYLIYVTLGGVKISKWFKERTDMYAKAVLVSGLLLVGLIISLSLYEYYFRYEKEPWREVGSFLSEHARRDHLILVLGGDDSYLDYYYEGPARILDADYMYGDGSAVQNYQELVQFLTRDKCFWIFVSDHSTNFYQYPEVSKKEKVKNLLQGNLDVVENIYDHTNYDLPGLYRARFCPSY